MIDQITDILRIVITLLFQLVLVTVLVALLMGEGASNSLGLYPLISLFRPDRKERW